MLAEKFRLIEWKMSVKEPLVTRSIKMLASSAFVVTWSTLKRVLTAYKELSVLEFSCNQSACTCVQAARSLVHSHNIPVSFQSQYGYLRHEVICLEPPNQPIDYDVATLKPLL